MSKQDNSSEAEVSFKEGFQVDSPRAPAPEVDVDHPRRFNRRLKRAGSPTFIQNESDPWRYLLRLIAAEYPYCTMYGVNILDGNVVSCENIQRSLSFGPTTELDVPEPVFDEYWEALKGLCHQMKSGRLVELHFNKCRPVSARKSEGGRAPYGYERMIVDAAGVEVKRLKAGEHKADKLQRIAWVPGDSQKINVILSIFEMSHRGKGLFAIVDDLNGKGIPSPMGGAWSKNQIHYILRNVAYIGTRLYNKHSFHDRSGTFRRGAIKP